jgi:ABC-type branched-subunit amino acid transport system permease subunit
MIDGPPVPRRRLPLWVQILIWAFGLAITSYAVARLVLDGRPHPYHWMAGLLGGVVGIAIGWLWFRWRGDAL